MQRKHIVILASVITATTLANLAWTIRASQVWFKFHLQGQRETSYAIHDVEARLADMSNQLVKTRACLDSFGMNQNTVNSNMQEQAWAAIAIGQKAQRDTAKLQNSISIIVDACSNLVDRATARRLATIEKTYNYKDLEFQPIQ